MHLFRLLIVVTFFLPNLLWAEEEEPMDVQLGEKLFKEWRFSYGFFKEQGSHVNAQTVVGDKTLDELETLTTVLQHPQQGQHFSCASCHFVDQITAVKDNFVLTYNDQSLRSKVPHRGDGVTRTTRNSMNMVLSSLEPGRPLHWDGEFFSSQDLACSSLVGRNMGWLSHEASQARQQIVQVIRKDDGSSPASHEDQKSYTQWFQDLGVDIALQSDTDLVLKVCEMLSVYMDQIDFSRDDEGAFNGSAYDAFLELNGLRRKAKANESSSDYLTYLRDHLKFKTDWLELKASTLQFHGHKKRFGAEELEGMKLFFGRAQCVTCHRPPDFTDFGFHNTGISQFEYDGLHGKGAFAKTAIPSWEERQKIKEAAFVPTESHPYWQGNYRSVPKGANPEQMDLGVWNILGHPDFEKNQKALRQSLCASYKQDSCLWSDDEFLNRSIALFKTPTLRSLGQSKPYMHNGMAKDLLDVMVLYLRGAHGARKGYIRNSDPFMKAMQITPADFQALIAFLKSLDEDYE